MNQPTKSEAFSVFARIGWLSFGGPAAQIALMHRYLVDEKQWLSERQFLNGLSFCMLLPGPEAMQLATYTGWRLHGFVGGLTAGLLFVLPGAFVVLALAAIYASYGNLPVIGALFMGVKAAVLIIVIEALLRVAKKALKGASHWLISGLSFVGIFFLSLPFPLIILLAGLYGFIAGGWDENSDERPVISVPIHKTLLTILIGLTLWLGPLWAVDMVYGTTILGEIGAFFSKLSVVTFGGAYAVLAYMAQDVVTGLGWLSAGEMIDGLGLAETTPGPLILVTEFVGYIAGFREGGFWLGLAGALVTLWATFAPCFLWIFTGAPYIEWIGAQPRLSGALTAITAAVVGVILNLSIWFGLHVLFQNVEQVQIGFLTLWTPEITSIDLRVLGLATLCGLLLLKWHWGIGRVLALSAISGLILTVLF